MYTRSAVFRRNAASEPDWPSAVAFRRNTVTSLRQADACRTLARRRRSDDSRCEATWALRRSRQNPSAEPDIRVHARSALNEKGGRTEGVVAPARRGLNLSELAAEDRRLVRADREPDANAGAPGEEVPQVRGKRPLHAIQGDCSRLSAARIPGSADARADAHA
jgi:hypothetical protein